MCLGTLFAVCVEDRTRTGWVMALLGHFIQATTESEEYHCGAVRLLLLAGYVGQKSWALPLGISISIWLILNTQVNQLQIPSIKSGAGEEDECFCNESIFPSIGGKPMLALADIFFSGCPFTHYSDMSQCENLSLCQMMSLGSPAGPGVWPEGMVERIRTLISRHWKHSHCR